MAFGSHLPIPRLLIFQPPLEFQLLSQRLSEARFLKISISWFIIGPCTTLAQISTSTSYIRIAAEVGMRRILRRQRALRILESEVRLSVSRTQSRTQQMFILLVLTNTSVSCGIAGPGILTTSVRLPGRRTLWLGAHCQCSSIPKLTVLKSLMWQPEVRCSSFGMEGPGTPTIFRRLLALRLQAQEHLWLPFSTRSTTWMKFIT